MMIQIESLPGVTNCENFSSDLDSLKRIAMEKPLWKDYAATVENSNPTVANLAPLALAKDQH